MDYAEFANYTGVEDDDTAEAEIKGQLDKQHLKAFNTLEQLQAYLQHSCPILNKIGMVTRERAGLANQATKP